MKISIKESDVLKACIHYLALRKDLGFFWRNNSTGVFDPKLGGFRMFNAPGMIKGVADILGILKGGRFFACEVKRPGGKMRPDQVLFLKEIESRGGVALVTRSVDELEKQLGEI